MLDASRVESTQLESLRSATRCKILHERSNGAPLFIGTLGTSLTYGSDLANRTAQSWPYVLERLLRTHGVPHARVLNAAMRASSADFAALCFDEVWQVAGETGGHSGGAPPLVLAVIEYNWSSHPAQIAALLDVLHRRAIPAIAVLYYHPVNLRRLRIRGDRTPDLGAETVGRHAAFAELFSAYGVPYVNTSVINRRVGWRAMLANSLSVAHLTSLGHALLAREVAMLLGERCDQLTAQLSPPQPALKQLTFAVAPLSQAPLSRSASTSIRGASRGMRQDSTSVGSGLCKIGRSLRSIAIHLDGFEAHEPADGRTAGMIAQRSGASITFGIHPTSLFEHGAGGFLSLAAERTWRSSARAVVSCHGVCVCASVRYSAHTEKRYSYTQRTSPVWLALSAKADARRRAGNLPQSARCLVRLNATAVTSGRLFLKALIFSPPFRGNRSVSISSLYSLPG